MKFTIQRDLLLQSIQDVQKAISTRTAIPILTGMKIETHADGIVLTGSDSDISIESFIPKEENGIVNIEDIEEGAVVIHARYFPDIIRKLPEQNVSIETDADLNVTIRSGQAIFNLNGQDADEYPLLPELQADDSLQIDAGQLKNLIKQTVFAVSTMETRPILTGVKMQLENNLLSFTATDSHRLALREVPIEQTDLTFNCVIPGKSLHELNKILADDEEKVEIRVTKNQILFRTKHLKFLSRLLDGNYPETSRLIPKEHKTVLYVRTKDLINTIDRASLLARTDDNNVVKLTTQGTHTIEITSHSPEVGHVTENVSAQSIEGEELRISFSSKYMLDALKVIEHEEIKIEFTGAMRPFIIRPINDTTILQLILPVRTF
ncbi:MAG TPA: DNA polymerase III subunit beta [Bacillota bacterium]|nr:DNA polymerase III subunit beta [Bacillota bacterium]